MNRIFLLLITIHCSLITFSQPCNSLRYQDTIFHDVTITSVKFGTATPYGLLALPQDLYLDFYEPTGDTLSKRPLIIFQFGGGFTIGWRSEPDIPQFCNYFAKCGYTVASIDYRLGLNPVDTNSTIRAFYRGVQDERSAIRFLSQRAMQYKFDTSLIILTGTSAGCFCAFANAFMHETERPASTFGTLLEPNDLGCMDCSGNTDLGHHIPRIKAIVNQWGAMLDTAFIESAENVPVISFHGDQDVLVPYVYGYPFNLPVFPAVYGSVPIHERLNNAGISNVLHPLVGFGHEPELLNPQLNDTIYNYSREFLFQLLKPNTSNIIGDSVACSQTVVQYSVLNNPGSKYCWTINGNGTIISDNGNSITVIWNDSGTVSVSVREINSIDAAGEERTFQTQVYPAVIAGIGFNADELQVTFQNLSVNANNYQWSFGDGDMSLDSNPIKDYESGGTYLITLITDNGFCFDTSGVSITIDSCPVADITFQLNNRNAFLNTTVTNTLSYSWNFGDGDSASVNFPNVFHQYNQDGDYTVILKVISQLGCEHADTVQLHVEVTSVEELLQENINCDASGCHLQLKGVEEYSLELLDVDGRKIIAKNFAGNFTLSNSNLAKGIYILKVSNAQNHFVKKWMVY